MKKSIFKASFEESLNLLDDASLQYIKKDYYEKLGKGLNNGKTSIGFRIKSILYSILFVFGGNFLLALFAFSLNDAEPKDLTLPVHKPSLLTPELFLICCFIWLSLVLIGKFVPKLQYLRLSMSKTNLIKSSFVKLLCPNAIRLF